jgi:hypothetical protein
MKELIQATLLVALSMPSAVLAQSSFNGTWKLDVSTLPIPKKPYVWLLQDGTYQCKSCVPPINVKADGHDQFVAGQPYDTISVRIVDSRTVVLIEKKNDRVVSDETFAVSSNGDTATDEFANWKVIMNRISKGPSGSHALSGSWQQVRMESISDKGLLVTYTLQDDTLSMSRPSGQSYTASLDGADAPYTGDPGINRVSVRAAGVNTIEETDKLDGKITSVARMRVAPDGKSMIVVLKNAQGRTTGQFTAKKQ